MSFQTYRRLLAFLRPFTGWAVGAVGAGLLMLLGALLQLPAPLLTRHLIDRVIPRGDFGALHVFVGGIAGLLAAGVGVTLVQNRFSSKVRYGAEALLRRALLAAMLGSRKGIQGEQGAGYLLSRVDDDVQRIQSLFLDPLITLVLQGLTFAVGVGLVLHLHPRMALVALSSLPVFAVTYLIFSRRVGRLAEDRQEAWALFRASLQEVLARPGLIQAISARPVFLDRCGKKGERALEHSRSFELTQVAASAFTGLTASVLPLFVLWYGVREILLGRFTVGGFIAFNSAIGYLYGPVRALVSLRLDLKASMVAGRRVLEVLDEPQEHDDFGQVPPGPLETLEVRHLRFSPAGEPGRGLAKTSFRLGRGESLALIGGTGAGKSTLARLLIGSARPDEGSIHWNGVPYPELDLRLLRKSIGYVPQDPDLFDGTILENICLFVEDPQRGWIEDLVDICLLREAMARFPKGLNTQVREAGAALSGGERARVALARALYAHPELLLLDEATGSLDPSTELDLVKNLDKLTWRPAILFITHRHGLLGHFDQVLRLEAPRLEAAENPGSPAEAALSVD